MNSITERGSGAVRNEVDRGPADHMSGSYEVQDGGIAFAKIYTE